MVVGGSLEFANRPCDYCWKLAILRKLKDDEQRVSSKVESSARRQSAYDGNIGKRVNQSPQVAHRIVEIVIPDIASDFSH